MAAIFKSRVFFLLFFGVLKHLFFICRMGFAIKGYRLKSDIFGKLVFTLLLVLLSFYFMNLTDLPSSTVCYAFADIL